MRLTVEADRGKFSISAEWTNPLKYYKVVEAPKPSEYQLPLFEVEVGENGVIPQPKGSNRFLESLKKPFKALSAVNIFRRQKTEEQPEKPVTTNQRGEGRDNLVEEFRSTTQKVEYWLKFGTVAFTGISSLLALAHSQNKQVEINISSPPAIPTPQKPSADLSGSLPPTVPHVSFVDIAKVIEAVDQVQQNLHPELAQAPKVEIPQPPTDEEVLTDQKLTDEQIIAKVATGQGQFSQILALLKENGEENPSSDRMIEMFRLNFLAKVEDFKASAYGIINNPYKYPDQNMRKKAADQLKAIEFLSESYEKDYKLAFTIELEKLRQAQNYSAPPPENLEYAQAA